MASKGLVFVMCSLIMASTLISSIDGRKILMMKEHHDNIPYLEDRLYLASLPKGKELASAPSKKGHGAGAIDQKLIVRHLSDIKRILRSVPSPGAGH